MTDELVDALLARRPVPQSLPVIDAHAHLGSYGRFFIPSPDAATMVRVMDRCGVQRTILSSHLAIVENTRVGNEQTARVTEQWPGRLFGYVVANPHYDYERELRRWADHPAMVGVKLHPDLHEYALTGSAYAGVFEFAEATGAVILTHTWGGSRYNDVDMVRDIAGRYPGVRILAGHAGGPRETFPAMIELARDCPNVYLEICGTYMTSYWIRRMVRTLGPGKVIYGSDFPFLDMRYSIGRVVFSELSLTERLDVLGGAIAHLVGWKALDRENVS